MKIGTHDGVFHADEVIACSIIATVMDSTVVRSRDPKVLAGCQILVDVGGESNGETRFDHHQKGGAGVRENGTPYASAGLVWKKYGREYISVMYPDATKDQIDKVWSLVDKKFMESIDSLDCGYGSRPDHFTFSAALSALNPSKGGDEEAAFAAAMNIAEVVLTGVVGQSLKEVIDREVIGTIFESTTDGIAVFPEFVSGITSGDVPAHIAFVVYPSPNKGWMVQQVPLNPGSFKGRIPLPEEWAGLRGEDLASKVGFKKSGVNTFVHIGRFIGGAETLDDAILMATLAIEKA